MKVVTKMLPALVRMLTNKRTTTIVIREGAKPLDRAYWDGGTIEEYYQITSQSVQRLHGTTNPMQTVHNVWQVRDGVAVATGGQFCGKPAGLVIEVAEYDLWWLIGLKAPTELRGDTPLGILADWLDEHSRDEEAVMVRKLAGFKVAA